MIAANSDDALIVICLFAQRDNNPTPHLHRQQQVEHAVSVGSRVEGEQVGLASDQEQLQSRIC